MIANTLIHELCHEQNTATSHDHGAEFYMNFHEVLCGKYNQIYGTGIRVMASKFLMYAQKEGLKFSRGELRDLDREVEFERDVLDSEDFIESIKQHSLL